MPAAMAGTNTSAARMPDASETSAGPGQNPPSAQPTPKIAAPPMQRASISLRPRAGNRSANSGARERRAIHCGKSRTAIPETITKSRLASKAKVTSRNPNTLLGWVRPDKASPTPNTTPAMSATRLAFTALLRGGDG